MPPLLLVTSISTAQYYIQSAMISAMQWILHQQKLFLDNFHAVLFEPSCRQVKSSCSGLVSAFQRGDADDRLLNGKWWNKHISIGGRQKISIRYDMTKCRSLC